MNLERNSSRDGGEQSSANQEEAIGENTSEQGGTSHKLYQRR